jgi:hypothetical protein
MPNHVDNTITIIASKASDLDFFVSYLNRELEANRFVNDYNRESGFSFHPFVPVGLSDSAYDSAWYEWNIENWHTKWDAYEVNVERRGNIMNFWFNTAWDVPEPVFRRMTEMFPELRFEFRSIEEQGWGAEYEGSEGQFSMTDSWDIPANHAERIKRQGYCWECDSEDDSIECASKEEEVNA